MASKHQLELEKENAKLKVEILKLREFAARPKICTKCGCVAV